MEIKTQKLLISSLKLQIC